MKIGNFVIMGVLGLCLVTAADAQQGATAHTGKKAPAVMPAKTAPAPSAPAAAPKPQPARGKPAPAPAPAVKTFQPPANVSTTPRPGGGNIHRDPQGRTWETNQRGQVTHYSAPGREAHFGDNGRITQARVTRPDGSTLRIDHPMHGQPRTEVVRRDGSRVVVFGTNRGYSERPLGRPGFVARTYVAGGQTTTVVYRSFVYGGATYYRYVPGAYYAPGFYAWAYSPWRSPFAFSFGWGMNTPWLGFYSGYFAPSPVYASPAAVVTDQVMGQNLQAAYDTQAPPDPYAGQPSGPISYANTPVTPEVKAMLTNEVAAQMQAQAPDAQSATAQSAPVYMDPNHRTFIVGSNADLTTDQGPCPVTPGDVLFRADAAAAPGSVGVTVMTSKAGDCRTGITAQVDVTILQEWYNQFQQQVGSGMATLAGASGLPAQPAPGIRQAPDGTAPPDPSAASAVQGTVQDAIRTEGDVAQSAAPQKP